jgi:hypothetical protein
MNFSLAPSKQADSSFLSREPAEIRNEIYTLCGFKYSRIHLCELQEGVKVSTAKIMTFHNLVLDPLHAILSWGRSIPCSLSTIK